MKNRNRLQVVSRLVSGIIVLAIAAHGYASATPHMTPLHSGLVSLAAGQTVRLNVTLNPELISPTQSVTLTLTFDGYETPLIGTDNSAASVARIAIHKSVRVTLQPGDAAFFQYSVPRESTGQLVGASVGIDNPDLRTAVPAAAIMPTLEGFAATGQVIFVLPGQSCGFQEVENRPAPPQL